MCITGGSEEEKKEGGAENIFEEMTAKILPNLMQILNPQIQKAQPT